MQIWLRGEEKEKYQWEIRNDGFNTLITFLKKQIKALEQSSKFLTSIGLIYSKAAKVYIPPDHEINFDQLQTVLESLNSSGSNLRSYGKYLTYDISDQFLKFSTVLEIALENMQNKGKKLLTKLQDGEQRYQKVQEQLTAAVEGLALNNTGEKNWLENLTSKTDDQYLSLKKDAKDNILLQKINLQAVLPQFEAGMRELLTKDVKNFFTKRKMAMQEGWKIFKETFLKTWMQDRQNRSLKEFVTKLNIEPHMVKFKSLCQSKIETIDLKSPEGCAKAADQLKSLVHTSSSLFCWWYQTLRTFATLWFDREKALLNAMEKVISQTECGLFYVVEAFTNQTKSQVTSSTACISNLDNFKEKLDACTDTDQHLLKLIRHSVFKIKSTAQSILKMENASQNSKDNSIPLEVRQQLLEELHTQLDVYQKDGMKAMLSTVEKLTQHHQNKINLLTTMLTEFAEIRNEKNPWTKDVLHFCENFHCEPDTIPEEVLRKINKFLFTYKWDHKQLNVGNRKDHEVDKDAVATNIAQRKNETKETFKERTQSNICFDGNRPKFEEDAGNNVEVASVEEFEPGNSRPASTTSIDLNRFTAPSKAAPIAPSKITLDEISNTMSGEKESAESSSSKEIYSKKKKWREIASKNNREEGAQKAQFFEDAKEIFSKSAGMSRSSTPYSVDSISDSIVQKAFESNCGCSTEIVINDYACTFFAPDKTWIKGIMYVTKETIWFCSVCNELCFSIEFNNIISIRLIKWTFLSANVIRIEIEDDEYLFSSFLNRKKCKENLIRVWKSNLMYNSKSLSSSFNESAKLKPEVKLTNTRSPSIEDIVDAWENIPVIFPEDIKTDEDSKSHMTKFSDVEVALSSMSVFDRIFSNAAKKRYADFYNKADKASAIEVSPWRLSEDVIAIERIVTYSKSVAGVGPFGMFVSVRMTQRVWRTGNDSFNVTAKITTKGNPYSDMFFVEHDWRFTPGTEGMTKVKLASALVFKVRPLMGSVMESRFMTESVEFHRCFVLFIKEQVDTKGLNNLEEQYNLSRSNEEKKFHIDRRWLGNKVVSFLNEYGTFTFIMLGVALLIAQFITKGNSEVSTGALEVEMKALRDDVKNLLDLLEKEALSIREEIKTTTQVILSSLGKTA